MTALFNFSEFNKTVKTEETDGVYRDLITGEKMQAHGGVEIPGYGVYWLVK